MSSRLAPSAISELQRRLGRDQVLYESEDLLTYGYDATPELHSRPDVVVFPTGGGTGLVAMWKAFEEMEQLGWIDSRRPRMISVQSTGCAPIVRAFEQGTRTAEPWQDAATIADGLRVPGAIGDFLILDALRDSGGTALAVPDEILHQDMYELGRLEGIFTAPESAATVSALRQLAADGTIQPDERVVLFLTGNGLKYHHLIE